MLLDQPARFLYRHQFDMYGAMRVLCTRYRCVMCAGVLVMAGALTLALVQPGVFAAIGITASLK